MSSKLQTVNALAFTLLVACNNAGQAAEEPQIFAVHDKNADWSAYHTFDVVEPDATPPHKHPPRGYTASNRIAVMRSIVSEMEGRGYVRDKTNPDLLITPMVRLQDVAVAVPSPWYNYYYGWYWGYGWGLGFPWYPEDLIILQAGTLIIDVVDVGDRGTTDDDKLVFRGYATAILPTDPTDVSDEIRDSVAGIFDYWPTD